MMIIRKIIRYKDIQTAFSPAFGNPFVCKCSKDKDVPATLHNKLTASKIIV